MKKIIIGLSRPIKFHIFAKGIQLFENTEFDHAYVKFNFDYTGKQVVFQASGLAVNLMCLDVFNGLNVITNEYEIEVSDEKHKEIVDFALNQLGKPYSMRDIFAILLYKLTGHKVIRGDDEKGFICSELVGIILHMVGIIEKTDYDFITPKDINDIMSNLKK